jgi:hypothetical protein
VHRCITYSKFLYSGGWILSPSSCGTYLFVSSSLSYSLCPEIVYTLLVGQIEDDGREDGREFSLQILRLKYKTGRWTIYRTVAVVITIANLLKMSPYLIILQFLDRDLMVYNVGRNICCAYSSYFNIKIFNKQTLQPIICIGIAVSYRA